MKRVFMVVVALLAAHLVTPEYSESQALVPRTGQTTSFATGDDGAVQAGVPFPVPRFTDNGDGTITDNLTGLIWLQNADCFGNRSWFQALNDANTLASGACGLTDGSQAGDWRLPNVRELHSLIHYGFFTPAVSNADGDAKWTTNGDAFNDLQSSSVYWSSTTVADSPDSAWSVGFGVGSVDFGSKSFSSRVVAVRGGL